MREIANHRTQSQPMKGPAKCPQAASKENPVVDLGNRSHGGRIVSLTCRSRLGRSGSCGTRLKSLLRYPSYWGPVYG